MPDILDPWCIYTTAEEAQAKVKEILAGKDVSNITKLNYERVYAIDSYQPMRDRWKEIYEYLKTKYLA